MKLGKSGAGAAVDLLETWDEVRMKQREYHHRRLDRLHRRYLSSIKMLAQIR